MAMPEWLDTFVFVILPNIFWLLYGWAREWQTLIAAFFIVAAVRYFARATIRASRTLAEAIMRSARMGILYSDANRPAAQADFGSRRLAETPSPSHVQDRASEPPAAAPPLAEPEDERTAVPEPSSHAQADMPPDLMMGLATLRNAIRAALAAIPPTHSNIGQKGEELYGKVIAISFENMAPAFADPEALPLFEKLKAEMQALHRVSGEAVHAQQAWEGLARINRLARELQTKLAAASSPPNINVVKEIG